MGERSVVVRGGLGLCLAVLGATSAFAACNANVETKCFDGPCNEQDDPVTTVATTDTEVTSGTTSECHPSKNGSDACSDEPQTGDLPCDVFDILKAKCQTCHTDPHGSNAPIDLLTCDRFHEQDCGPVRTRFRTVDYYVFCSGEMPQGAKLLTDAEKQTLRDWLDACAPCVAAGTGCSGTPSQKACYQD